MAEVMFLKVDTSVGSGALQTMSGIFSGPASGDKARVL